MRTPCFILLLFYFYFSFIAVVRRAAIKQKRGLVLFYFYFSFIAVVRAAKINCFILLLFYFYFTFILVLLQLCGPLNSMSPCGDESLSQIAGPQHVIEKHASVCCASTLHRGVCRCGLRSDLSCDCDLRRIMNWVYEFGLTLCFLVVFSLCYC